VSEVLRLFRGTARAIAIRGALDLTATQGKRWIQQDTPVDTGRLRASFKTRQYVKDARVLFINEARNSAGTAYFPFVEYGTRFMKPRRMVAKNMPRIERLLERNLRRIPRWL
jgi:hypothetical protein